MGDATLSVWDYVVFASTLLVSVGIGAYYAIRNRVQTTEDYLLGGRKLPWFPVALSMTTSFMSAIIILGTPSEVYYYGTMYWWTGLTYVIMSFITCTIYIPVFCGLRLTSCYKYLELRFNKTVKICGTIAYLVQTILYLGLVTYLPALALNQVTSLSLWGSLIATGIACILYSTIGGMRGIVAADSFQLCIMIAGLLAIIIKGALDAGGMGNIISDGMESGKVKFDDASLDPRVRHTIWSLLIGGSFTWVANYGIGQSQVQRYLSCRSKRDANIAVAINCFILNVILALVMLVGLICASHFKGCDPLLTGDIKRPDQMVPLMVIQKLSVVPGVPGLVISAAYSGTLSSVSTGIHSMSCVVLEDFIRPLWPNLTERRMTLISRLLTLGFGFLTIIVAFGASKLSFILQAALSVWGVIGGPLVGVFTLGLFFPFANSYGALLGQFCGFCIALWAAVGSEIYKTMNTFTNKLDSSDHLCPASNVTFDDSTTIAMFESNTTSTAIVVSDGSDTFQIYFLSYLYLGVLSAVVTVAVGLVTSWVTGIDNAEIKYLCPPVRYLMTFIHPQSGSLEKVPVEGKYQYSPNQSNHEMEYFDKNLGEGDCQAVCKPMRYSEVLSVMPVKEQEEAMISRNGYQV